MPRAAADVLVVAPVLGSPLHRWTSDDAEDRAHAEERLEESIGCLRKHGLRAHGTLGDADPVQAVADALHQFPAEEIVICLERAGAGALASQGRSRADDEPLFGTSHGNRGEIERAGGRGITVARPRQGQAREGERVCAPSRPRRLSASFRECRLSRVRWRLLPGGHECNASRMKVCVVGASGKLGQYMVQHALDRGYDIVGVCREKSVGKLERIQGADHARACVNETTPR